MTKKARKVHVKKGFKVHAHPKVRHGFHVHKLHPKPFGQAVTVKKVKKAKKAEKPKKIVGLGYKKAPKRGPYSKGPSKWEQVGPPTGLP